MILPTVIYFQFLSVWLQVWLRRLWWKWWWWQRRQRSGDNATQRKEERRGEQWQQRQHWGRQGKHKLKVPVVAIWRSDFRNILHILNTQQLCIIIMRSEIAILKLLLQRHDVGLWFQLFWGVFLNEYGYKRVYHDGSLIQANFNLSEIHHVFERSHSKRLKL
jgi:hypothetical protein